VVYNANTLTEFLNSACEEFCLPPKGSQAQKMTYYTVQNKVVENDKDFQATKLETILGTFKVIDQLSWQSLLATQVKASDNRIMLDSIGFPYNSCRIWT
jgi:hypothetical protein